MGDDTSTQWICVSFRSPFGLLVNNSPVSSLRVVVTFDLSLKLVQIRYEQDSEIKGHLGLSVYHRVTYPWFLFLLVERKRS